MLSIKELLIPKGRAMKKILSLMLVITLALTWTPVAFATAVTGDRANDANDLTAGAAFDNLANHTLTVADGATFTTGVITTAGNGGGNAGIVTFAGSSTINTAASTNVIGTGANALNTVNAGAAGATVTAAGNVFSTTTNLTGTGTLALNGNLTGILNYNNGATGTVSLAAGKTITGAVNNATTGQGTLTLGSGSSTTTTVGSTGNGLAAINLNGGNASIGGNTKAVGFSLGANTLAVTGTFATPATGTISTTATSGTAYGKITSTGIATVTAGTAVTVNVAGYVPNGSSLTIVDGTGGAAVGAATITSTSPNVTFSQTASTSDLVLTATRNAIGSTGNGSAIGTVVNGLGTPTGDLATVVGALDSLTSASAVNQALIEMAPDNNGVTTQASFNSVNQSINAITGHLAEGSSAATGNTGVSTGDFWTDNGIWAKGIGNSTEQDNHKGVNGYDATMWGVIGGMDGVVAQDTVLGFAGGYAGTNVDNNSEAGGTDISSYIGSLYLGYDDPSPWYGNFGFTFTWNNYEGTRPISFGSINRTAKSDYDGQVYTGFADLGYVITDPNWNMGDLEVTPLAGFTYSHLELDGYTETEAQDLNLIVASQSYDKAQSALGVKLAYPTVQECGKWVPEAHFRWLYDFVGDKAATTSTFSGGGSSFNTNGLDPEQSTYNFGAGVTFFSKNNISVTGVYDFEFATDYASHTGQGVIRYEF